MSEQADRGVPEEGGLLDWLEKRLNLVDLFSILTGFGLFYGEVDTRKPLREALAEAGERPNASYTRGLRILGLVTVVLLLVEGLSGLLLALYYLPTIEGAHTSIGTIMRDVHFGGLIHQVHYWGAQLLIAVLILRLLRFFVQRVYEPPRELFWVLAVLLLLVVFHADMSGRVLPWTSTAYWSGVRALEILQAVPIYGDVTSFVLGAEVGTLTDLTLLRSYMLHIMLLPGLALGLVYLHFSGIRRLGLREMKRETPRTGRLSMEGHILNLAILTVVVVGVLVSLAVLLPTNYEPEADPYSTVPGIGPAWYLLAPFGFLELTSFLPRWVGGLSIFLGFTAFILAPFLLRRRRRDDSHSVLADPWILAAGVLVFVLWLALTLYGSQVV